MPSSEEPLRISRRICHESRLQVGYVIWEASKYKRQSSIRFSLRKRNWQPWQLKMAKEAKYVEEGSLPYRRRWSAANTVTFLLCLGLTSGIAVYACTRTQGSSSPVGGSSFEGPLFVFGDSYVDTGNLQFGPARKVPYGMTWPGYPDGRFSDGLVQADYLATQVFGRPAPLPLASSSAASFSQGINFAVGGAGETSAFGSPTISTQIGWLKALVEKGIYPQSFLASSVTLLCVAGNDYIATSGSIEELANLPYTVVSLIEQNLRELFQLGLRNIMVTTVAPWNCLPPSTFRTNFTTCERNQTVQDIMLRHNSLLESTLVTLSKEFTDVNFVLLRLGDALAHVQSDPTAFGILEPLKPCCLGSCGETDSSGNPYYTVCSSPETHVFWDTVHPTQAAWQTVVNLYAKDPAFTTFAPTLTDWAKNLLQNLESPL